jgi:hypothetical protein
MKDKDELICKILADTLIETMYCKSWTLSPDGRTYIELHDTIHGEKHEPMWIVHNYTYFDDPNELKAAVQQITTLEQWLIRNEFDLWSKHSIGALTPEGDLMQIVGSVVYNCFEELVDNGTFISVISQEDADMYRHMAIAHQYAIKDIMKSSRREALSDDEQETMRAMFNYWLNMRDYWEKYKQGEEND